MEKDGFIGRPHWSDHGSGPFLHVDQYDQGQKVDHVPVNDALGAFAIGAALEATRRENR